MKWTAFAALLLIAGAGCTSYSSNPAELDAQDSQESLELRGAQLEHEQQMRENRTQRDITLQQNPGPQARQQALQKYNIQQHNADLQYQAERARIENNAAIGRSPSIGRSPRR